jgi:hypothetical protein
MIGLPFALNAGFHVETATVGHWMHWLVLGGYGLLFLLFARSFRMRSFIYPKVSIRVIGDGLEVTRGGRGEVFPLSSAQLGPWATSGTLMGTPCTCEAAGTSLFSADRTIAFPRECGSTPSPCGT